MFQSIAPKNIPWMELDSVVVPIDAQKGHGKDHQISLHIRLIHFFSSSNCLRTKIFYAPRVRLTCESCSHFYSIPEPFRIELNHLSNFGIFDSSSDMFFVCVPCAWTIAMYESRRWIIPCEMIWANNKHPNANRAADTFTKTVGGNSDRCWLAKMIIDRCGNIIEKCP